MNGRIAVTSGDARIWPTRAWYAFLVLGSAFMVVNTTTEIMEHARDGADINPVHPLIWESSSFIVWAALAPFIGLVVRHRPPDKDKWHLVFAVHLAASTLASLLHIFGMLGVRLVVYQFMGQPYDFFQDAPFTVFLYEWRKDIISYFLISAIYWLLDGGHARSSSNPEPAEPHTPDRLLLRESGGLSFVLIADIQWLQAAGNYVEIHLSGESEPVLTRQTLKSLEHQLDGQGFVRIHRSRLVNVGYLSEVSTRGSGDFEIVLTNGEILNGARRHRASVLAAITASPKAAATS